MESKLSGGENGNIVAQKGMKLFLQAAGGHVIGAQQKHGLLQTVFHACDEMAAVDLTQAGDGRGFAGCECGNHGSVGGQLIQEGEKLFHTFPPRNNAERGKIPPFPW